MEKENSFKLEFVVIMASLMAIVTLAIDALLPAIPNISNYLSVSDSSKNQQLITMIFLGIGFGQLVFGPLSDSFGRKPIVFTGFIIFIIASIICLTTKNFEVMIFGRILQGIGLSSPRSLSLSMIRDTYSGNHMAKMISMVMLFCIFVPTIAPSLGQILVNTFNWQAIFYFNIGFGVLIMIWFCLRQKETLPKDKRIKFSTYLLFYGFKEFLKHKESVAYTVVSGFITGSFMVYLSTSQQIFQEQYNLVNAFPYIIACLTISVGFATYINSRLVLKYGMWRIAYIATIAYSLIPILYMLLFWSGKNPHALLLVSFFSLQFFAAGFLFVNLSALAMEPLGHIAGIGAAINGFISTVMAVPIADYIGRFVVTSVLPLFIGFSIFGVLSLTVFLFLKSKERTVTT